MVRFSVAKNKYSQTAILAAVKKQQVFADWRVDGQDGDMTVLSYEKSSSSTTEAECLKRLRQQLDDEVLREKLESDFGHVRDMLVDAALSPIIGKKDG